VGSGDGREGITVARLPDVPLGSLSDDALGIDLAIWFVDRWDGDPANTAREEHDVLAGAARWRGHAPAGASRRPGAARRRGLVGCGRGGRR
jgi:hypothetical protein